MILHILFGHRHGEYAPEPLHVASGMVMEDAPEWMEERIAEVEATQEYAKIGVVAIDIDGNKVMDILYPKHLPLKGTIGESGK